MSTVTTRPSTPTQPSTGPSTTADAGLPALRASNPRPAGRGHRSTAQGRVLAAVVTTIALLAGSPSPALAGSGASTSPAPATAQTAAVATTDSWCNRQVGSVGSIPSLGFGKRSWPLTGGLHMNTYNGTVARNTGGGSATTHLYNSYWGMGYTGAVLVVLKNSCGEPIGVTTPKQWGVDAKSWFWNANERWELHSQNLGVDITSRTASVEVIHNRVTGTNTVEVYRGLRDWACDVYPDGCKYLPKL